MEGPVELYVRDGLLGVHDVNLRDGNRGLVLQDEMAGAGEGALFGKDVDIRVSGDDLGLRNALVLFEVPLVVGPNITAGLGVQIFVEDVGVVVVPSATADGHE